MEQTVEALQQRMDAQLVAPQAIESGQIINMPVTRKTGVFDNEENFAVAQRMCKALAASSLVPVAYQGNISNCMIALEISQRTNASPLMIMQNLYIVHGNPGWSSQYIIASINSCGRFSPLQFEMVGEQGKDTWGCFAKAKGIDGEIYTGATVTITMAKAEGWVQKKGSKWQSMPEVMLRYRAASFFGRVYAPEILMGMKSSDEIEDIEYLEVNTSSGEVTSGKTKSKAKGIDGLKNRAA